MKKMKAFLIGIFTVCGATAMKAQDVYLSVPENNIFNRIEFTSVPTRVMTNANRTGWDYTFFGFTPVAPTFTSVSGPNFTQPSSSFTLPSSTLLWQLESMGGQPPATGYSGSIPGFQSFNTSAVKWFEPAGSIYFAGGFNRGNINFTFKIPAAQFAANAYRAGNYSMDITQNYNDFVPRNFKTILVIPQSIRWLSSSLTKYLEISSLNDYRITGNRVFSLDNAELAQTVDFNVWAKAAANIQFTSSKGVPGTRNIGTLKLGSNGSALATKALSVDFQNFSAANFSVVAGNRNNFLPELYVSAEDFKNFFFEAGTYTCELNFNARSTDNSINSLQNTAVQVKVLPLSEITIPGTGRNVNFNFNTAAQYNEGQSQMIPNQIVLSNNESFELYVKSDENYFKKGGLQTDINSNILQIGIDGSSVNVPLSKTPQKILFNGTPVLDRGLNVRYTIPPAGAQSLVGKENTTYSINVYYSFTAI